MAGLWSNVRRCLDVFRKARDDKEALENIREAIKAWLWAEDRKAVRHLPATDEPRQVGSHLVMTKSGERANVSIPQHRELSVGALRALIRAPGLTVDEFLELL